MPRKKNCSAEVISEDNLSKEEKFVKVAEQAKKFRQKKKELAIKFNTPPKEKRFDSSSWLGCPGGISKLRVEVSTYLAESIKDILDRIKYLATDSNVPPDTQLKACVEFLNRCVGKQAADVNELISNNFDLDRSSVKSAIHFILGKTAPEFLSNLNRGNVIDAEVSK